MRIRGSASTQHVLVIGAPCLEALQTWQWGCRPHETNKQTTPCLASLFSKKIYFIEYLFLFQPHPRVTQDPSSLTGIEPRPAALGVQSLNSWATREVLSFPLFTCLPSTSCQRNKVSVIPHVDPRQEQPRPVPSCVLPEASSSECVRFPRVSSLRPGAGVPLTCAPHPVRAGWLDRCVRNQAVRADDDTTSRALRVRCTRHGAP